MKRIFFKNLAFLFTLNLIIKPVWIFGIDRTVQNTVGTEQYGIYFTLFSLSFITQILLDLGISNFNNRYLAQQQEDLNFYFSRLIGIKIFLAIVYVAITLVAGIALGYSSEWMKLLMIIACNQMLASMIVYVRSNISAMHHFRMDSFLSVLDKAIMILICGAWLIVPAWSNLFSVQSFILSQLISYLITLLFAGWYALQLSGKIKLSASIHFTKDLVRKVLPFALLILFMSIYSRQDGVLIQKLLADDGAKEAGIYASAFRLLDAFNQFGYLFAVLLLPIFSRMISQGKAVDDLVRSSSMVLICFATMVCLSIAFFSSSIMHLLYRDATDYSSRILAVLIFCFAGTSIGYIFGTLLTANGNLKQLVLLAAFSVILNAALNFYFIPKFKALGAGISATATQTVSALAQVVLSFIIFKFSVNRKMLLRIISYIALLTILYWFFSSFNYNWILQFAIAGICAVALAFILKLISFREIQLLVAERGW